MSSKGFIDKFSFFNDEDLIVESSNDLSSNFKLLVELCKRLDVKNIDFLACNSLTYPKWVKYYALLNTFTKTELNLTGVIVGASNDKTGNIKYGGDWEMESTGSNIELTYFTEAISRYANTLGTPIPPATNTTIYIRQDINDIKYQIGTTASNGWTTIDIWPAVFTNSSPNLTLLTVQLYTPLTISSGTNVYFVAGSEYITFDGNNKNVTINGINGFFGLVQNGTIRLPGKSHITVKNIGVNVLNLSGLADYSGWVCQTYFAHIASNCAVINCYSSGPISGSGSGGIIGDNAGSEGGTVTVTNCYSSGPISGNYSGGIVGAIAINVTVTNCYSSGQISGDYSGGIVGDIAGLGSGTVTVTNCYSSGPISATAGGIVGSIVSNGTVTHCYSSGLSSHNPSTGGIISRSITDGTGNYSQANNGNSGVWTTNNTTNVLQHINTTPTQNTIWLNVKAGSPFLLYGTSDHYYNTNFYTTLTATTTINSYTNLTLVNSIAGNTFWIIPPTNNVSINSLGQMTSDTAGTYNNVYVISGNQLNPNQFNPTTIYGYNTIIFSLTVNPAVTPQKNSDVLYKLYSLPNHKKSTKRIKKYINKM